MMKIRWLGHAAFEISSREGIVYIDPWIENPKSPIKLDQISRADLIVVTHDHFDHLGNALDLAKRTRAKVCILPELADHFRGVSTHVINMGSLTKVGQIQVGFLQAFHTSSRAAPASVILKLEDKCIYHAGDTSLFRDMELIGELYNPELAMIPIGGFYTMGPREAGYALKLLKPRYAIPMHYATFPVLVQDPSEFLNYANQYAPEVKIALLQPGQEFQI